MTQAVTKKEANNVVAMPQKPAQTVLASDVIVPNLYLMQPMSKLVMAGKAQIGQVVRSTTGEVVFNQSGAGVNIIPLKMTMGWINEEKVGEKFEYRSRYERNAENELLPWYFHRNSKGEEGPAPFPGSTEWRRVQTITVFGLIKEDVENYMAEVKKAIDGGEMPDLDKSLLPVVITFRGKSFPGGKGFASYYAKYDDMRQYNANLKSYAYMLPLTCKLSSNSKGQFFVYETGKIQKVPTELMEQAARWYNYVQGTANIKVDESNLDEETDTVGDQSKF